MGNLGYIYIELMLMWSEIFDPLESRPTTNWNKRMLNETLHEEDIEEFEYQDHVVSLIGCSILEW